MDNLLPLIKKYWGYETFYNLQPEAMTSVLAGRDSLVVLPTGGGKSLCFQAPALAMEGMALVVSPLISLMKDQVDALNENGVPAVCIHSNLDTEESYNNWSAIRSGKLKLLYVSPERLLQPGFVESLEETPVSFVAVDEVHCVSMWGHDFRPEYRKLGGLKQLFPGIAVHGYTATATQHVRDDIVKELNLADPDVLVGSFHRPNLVYKVERSRGGAGKLRQLRQIIDRHPNESGIIYCITRKDVESLCADLADSGYKALPYHAGMEAGPRRANQEAFIREGVDIIVATVAFGMGIDKSNVRYIIHASMPKSLEHYQQETGRAGRDGLEAECVLTHSYKDFATWQWILNKNKEEGEGEAAREAAKIALKKLDEMLRYCDGVQCRHQTLLKYFGQSLGKDNCGACDVCLSDLDRVDDETTIAQKILSGIVRLREFFGGDYTSKVLTGSREQRILENHHDALSTYAILSEHNIRTVHSWIAQLTSQDYIRREGEFNVLKVTKKGWLLLKGEGNPTLLKPTEKEHAKSAVQLDQWEGVDTGLFEELRGLRKRIANEKDLPAYIVFGDASLRDMARRRPSTLDGFLDVKGVGERKQKEYGEVFLETVADYCRNFRLEMDAGPPARRRKEKTSRRERAGTGSRSPAKEEAWEHFRQGKSVEEVAKILGRATSTTANYLVEYIVGEDLTDVSPWIDPATFSRVEKAVEEHGDDLLRPLFEALDGQVSYDQIRLALACSQNQRTTLTPPE